MSSLSIAQKPRVWRPKRWWYGLIAWGAHRLFFGTKGGIEGIGKANVPKSGGVIIAPVHFSNLDPPAVASVCPRQLRFMAKQELFKGLFGWGISSVGAFPVRRGENDTDAIRKAIELLEDGQALLLFPEGERGDGVNLGSINRGVAMLAKRTGAKIVPTAIIGTREMLPRGAKGVKRGHVRIVFGVPFAFDDVTSASGGAGRDAFTGFLAARLVDLCAEHGLMLRGSEAVSA